MTATARFSSTYAYGMRSIAAAVLASILSVAAVAQANDGVLDAANEFPAVGQIFSIATIDGGLNYVGGYCSGSLIAPDLFLTAGHCQFFDSRARFETPGYEAEYWVSFDPIASGNDFRCHLRDIEHPNAGQIGCNPAVLNGATFHRGVMSIVHPNYTRLVWPRDGASGILETGLWGRFVDLAIVILETPVLGITPLATASLEIFSRADIGTPLTNVGYGVNYRKSVPAEPDQPGGNGPTVFQGGFGSKRVADIGSLRTVTQQEMIPTQQSALGEGSVCYGDSGSPLFFRETDGSVNQTVTGVLSGWAYWCMGAYDPFARVDSREAVVFLGCVETAGTLEEACECGIEDQLGLCH